MSQEPPHQAEISAPRVTREELQGKEEVDCCHRALEGLQAYDVKGPRSKTPGSFEKRFTPKVLEARPTWRRGWGRGEGRVESEAPEEGEI